MKKSIKMAGAFIGVIVGAGFASGQEILQFFTSFGWWGILGTAIATAFFSFLGMNCVQVPSFTCPLNIPYSFEHRPFLPQILLLHLKIS